MAILHMLLTHSQDPDSAPERWRTCVNHVDDGLGWILSRFFVEKAFSEKAKEFGDQIVSDIKEMFIKKIKKTAVSNSTCVYFILPWEMQLGEQLISTRCADWCLVVDGQECCRARYRKSP